MKMVKYFVFGVVTATFLTVIFVYWLPLQSFGFGMLLMDFAFLLLMGISILAIFISLLLAISKKFRGLSLRIIIISIAVLFSIFPSIIIGSKVRMNEFRKLADRSSRLVDSIKSFQQSEGRLPNDLNELVPKYLKEYPYTGMSSYPEYGFRIMPNGIDWELNIECGIGILNWDEFFYFSSQEYPNGSSYERLGDWVYFYE